MKIYTRGGDKGQTSLHNGIRVSKNHRRVATYGTFDELNSMIGFSLTYCQAGKIRSWLENIQRDLFTLGSWLASPKACSNIHNGRDPWSGEESNEELPVNQTTIDRIEQSIDEWERSLEPLKNFILPGGGHFGAALHMARTICRRAERECVALKEAGEESPAIAVQYLNRLSDALFVLARFVNKSENQKETLWT